MDVSAVASSAETQASISDAQSRFLSIKGKKVMVDTNVMLDLINERKSKQYPIIVRFLSQNIPYITDTVYYECLRNVNLQRYRDRRAAIETLLTDNQKRILHEDERVKDQFARIFFLYLHAFRQNPDALPFRKIEDMWIISSAIVGKMDLILTHENSADYCKDLFESQDFDIGDGPPLRIKIYNKKTARSFVNKIKKTKSVHIKNLNTNTLWPHRTRLL